MAGSLKALLAYLNYYKPNRKIVFLHMNVILHFLIYFLII
jgi:hypothetical protein